MINLDLTKKISLQELLDLCRKYDQYGVNTYQEHCYEGKSFFEFVTKEIHKDFVETIKLFLDYDDTCKKHKNLVNKLVENPFMKTEEK